MILGRSVIHSVCRGLPITKSRRLGSLRCLSELLSWKVSGPGVKFGWTGGNSPRISVMRVDPPPHTSDIQRAIGKEITHWLWILSGCTRRPGSIDAVTPHSTDAHVVERYT